MKKADKSTTARKPLTLADIQVTHTIGSKSLVRSGATIAQLIDATRHLHDPDETDLDFLNPAAIAIELDGVADILCCLSEAESIRLERALSYIGDQLRRIGYRVMALAPTSANQAPDWYKVEVTT